MPRIICTTCNERKSIDLFSKDPRCARGYAFRCQDCKNAAVAARPVKKNNAKANASKPWSQFRYDGTKYVTCPCKHEQCQVKIKESTAYRHMKYGVGYKFPGELKRIEDEKKQFARLFRDSDGSDSERDL